jgi:hypothetical protein
MGSGAVVVCPFCLSIYMGDHDEGDICPSCDAEEPLMNFEEFQLRLSTSFMEAISQERGKDE